MTFKRQYTTVTLASIGLITLLACGGGGGGSAPKTATTLHYTDPADGTYMLMKDASSTAGHLVLNLVGPDSSLSGVGFHLNADSTKVTWAPVSGTDKVTSTTFSAPVIASKTVAGVLQGGVFQKGKLVPAVVADPATVLATVALDLKSGVAVNSAVNLSAVNGKCVILEGPGSSNVTTPITITVGALVAE